MAETGFNGPPPLNLNDDDQFEMDLCKVLGEAPSLNDLGSTTQSGASIMTDTYGSQTSANPPHSNSAQQLQHNSPTSSVAVGIPRSQSVPPGNIYYYLLFHTR